VRDEAEVTLGDLGAGGAGGRLAVIGRAARSPSKIIHLADLIAAT
jgi:hypothetical protein